MLPHRHALVWFFVLLAALCAACDSARAATAEMPLPGHGRLVFTLPADWQMKKIETTPEQPPMVEFDPSPGGNLRMRVIVLWTKQPDSKYNRPEAVRQLVQRTGDSQLFTAVEQQIELGELRGGSGTGYWYALTDRAPQPGDFPYMLHGEFPVGPLLLDFTALSRSSLRDGDGNVLALIASATLLPEK